MTLTTQQLKNRVALLPGLLFTLALVACTQPTGRYCESISDCGESQLCTDGMCRPTADQADGSPAPISPAEDNAENDAAPAEVTCPEETHACVAAAPVGWSGPTIRVDGVPGEATPSCPVEFGDRQVSGKHDLSAEGSCGCSCGTTPTFNCSPGAIEGRNGPRDFPGCFGDCTSDYCTRQILGDGVCTSLSSLVTARDNLVYAVGQVTGGTCGGGTISENLDNPTFESETSLCAGELLGGCEQDSVCAPKLALDAQTCVFQAGEHECPANSEFTERLVTFDDYNDQRSCETCDCSPSLGGSCGSFEFFNDDPSCSESPYGQGICTAMPILIGGRVRYTKVSSISCNGTSNPPISGEVVGVGATTICCTAP